MTTAPVSSSYEMDPMLLLLTHDLAKTRHRGTHLNGVYCQDTCRYPSKYCGMARARKSNGSLHRFCEYHRRRANLNQQRWSHQRRMQSRHLPMTPEGEDLISLDSMAPLLLLSAESEPIENLFEEVLKVLSDELVVFPVAGASFANEYPLASGLGSSTSRIAELP
ncbi:hypothetical protein Poli38472_006904 [Pythium oligandrum]|uniref:Uncharacterized protein n=1 Tax=Pythium oligandrum TaxID=41045 RepID=A0A8K1C955_PYTOL|nr:hypothetical protein Poli38472_006904 [Pythium oligandrum]|eukprot:TMW58759.1 hypothetical protein Poli38472_006904 [Pythium oligandrum]